MSWKDMNGVSTEVPPITYAKGDVVARIQIAVEERPGDFMDALEVADAALEERDVRIEYLNTLLTAARTDLAAIKAGTAGDMDLDGLMAGIDAAITAPEPVEQWRQQR